MPHGSAWLQRLRFGCTVVLSYGALVAVVWLAQPAHGFNRLRPVALIRPSAVLTAVPTADTVSGIPVRIVIPGSNVDLPIDKGYYDSATNSWNLNGRRAQFAMISSPANNLAGDTFIYGHNNDYVFGALRHNTPVSGAIALLYTGNGHILQYRFQSVVSMTPDDVSVLDYDGPPVMTIQTCTGSLEEWRTMFRFSFDKVVQ